MKRKIGNIISLELRPNIRQIIMLVVLAIITLIFSVLTGGTFTSARNLSNILVQSSATAILAVGIVFVLVAGHIDLSIGSFVALVGAVGAKCMVEYKLGATKSIAIMLLVGLLLGAWQGYWVAYRRIPAFIVTLANMQIFRGGVLIVTGGITIAPMAPAFKKIGQGYLPEVFRVAGYNGVAISLGVAISIIFVVSEILKLRNRKRYGLPVAAKSFVITKILIISFLIILISGVPARHLGVPIAVVLVGVLSAIFSFISRNVTVGRHIYAIGGNTEAAALSGINIKRTTFMIFVIMGAMTSIASIVYTARVNAATSAAGQGLELDTIAAAILGGSSTMGGEGSISGALIGALIMTMLDNGMSIMNLAPEIQYIAKGIVLLLAVWLDVSTRKNVS